MSSSVGAGWTASHLSRVSGAGAPAAGGAGARERGVPRRRLDALDPPDGVGVLDRLLGDLVAVEGRVRLGLRRAPLDAVHLRDVFLRLARARAWGYPPRLVLTPARIVGTHRRGSVG